ncbi:hypothetical protein RFI_32299 [Reticulomyxa filosa]|uniref:NIF system FeS cluster assembly NifU C-terminal domain-containing protein n=1 Tax=Reticulomyxa filosa TaxID=46433 RepID=X6LT39_RETFI|nr:hypothetical protein RFI_32299 [Reticulomyxa filosa]|eukprot:ETO05098.1 hypothetical protein RFI_32299 [Reticulomyxa filosa]
MVLACIMDHLVAGFPIIKESVIKDEEFSEVETEIIKQIKEIIESRVRPTVAQDGGDIIYKGFKDGTVYLELQGSCSGCPSSTITLKNGIENMLKYYVPEGSERKFLTGLIKALWDGYRRDISFQDHISNNNQLYLDHFAIIDLPSENSGKNNLEKIIKKLGFITAGHGYIAEKQNPFLWMRDKNHLDKNPKSCLPQVVLADFRLNELSTKLRLIVEKYAAFAKSIDNHKLEYFEELLAKGDAKVIPLYVEFLQDYLTSRP